jgi:camphor 5-monooxygenase
VLEQGNKGFFEYVDPIIKARRGSKADDLISLMVNLDVNGEPISHENALGLVGLLLLAGLDTVVAFLNFTMIYLARHPEKVAELRSEPAKLASRAEELFRRFPVISEGRMIAKDFEYDGLQLKRGEMVLLPTALANLDADVYPDPFDLVFDRKGAPHLTFGGGVHRCAGALFARLELITTLEEWFKRIPEFSLNENEKIEYTSGMVANVANVPLVWSV